MLLTCLKQATLSRQDAVIKTGEPKKKEVFKTNLKIDFLRARARQIVKIVIHIAALRLKFHLVYLREVGLSLHSMLRTYLVQVQIL